MKRNKTANRMIAMGHCLMHFTRTAYFNHGRRCLVCENIIGYLNNHWTKHGLVCTHFVAFSMLIPNMGIIF